MPFLPKQLHSNYRGSRAGEGHNRLILSEKKAVAGGTGQEFDLRMNLTFVPLESQVDFAKHWVDIRRRLCRHDTKQKENCEDNKQTATSDKGQTQNASVFGRSPQERESRK